MITIVNSVFDAKGANKKDSVYGLTLNGAEDILIKDCAFNSTGYSAIMNHATGKVTVENCEFNCENNYNPIEGSQKVDNGDVVVKGCVFNGAPGNNYINFYQMAEGSVERIEGCSFAPTVDNNVIRFSNRTSANVKCFIKDCEYTFAEGTPTDYTGFILCQDYTSKSGVKQSFAGLKIDIDNVKCNGEVMTADGAAMGSVYYVYEDGRGVITGENDPVVVIH